jgi:hypothetical protein
LHEEGAAISALLAMSAVLVGLSAALAARAQLAHAAGGLHPGRPAWLNPHLWGSMLYELLAVSPLALYLYLHEPRWSTLYWLESSEPGWGFALGLVLVPPALAGLGFGLGAWLQRASGPLTVRGALAALAVALIVLVGLQGQRLLHVAREGAWDEAAGPSGQLLAVLAFALPVLLAGWLFMLALYWIEGRKLERMLAFQRETRGAESASCPEQAPLEPVGPRGNAAGF